MTTQAGTRVPIPDRPAPGPARAHRPAPWVRTRLRAMPLAALLTAALAFVTVFLAAAFPRIADRGADTALQEFTRGLGANVTNLEITSATAPGDTAANLDDVRQKLAAQIGRQLPLSPSGEVHGTRTKTGRQMFNPGFTRLSDNATPALGLYYLHGLADRVTLTAGTWPGPAPTDGPLPVVLSRQAAEAINIKIGDVIESGTDGPVQLRSTVVGLYQVNDPQDPFWEGLGCPTRACLGLKGDDAWYWTSGFVDGGSLAALGRWGSAGQNFWRLPVEPGSLRADQLDQTRATLGSYTAGPGMTALIDTTLRADLHATSLLPDVLVRATARYQAAAPLGAIGPAGVAGVAVVVLCLAAALSTDRRTAEIRLLQARGASRSGVLLRLLGEGAVTVLPAAVLGTALALVLLPTPRWGNPVLLALAVTLLAILAFPTRAARLWARPRAAGGWRRVIGELAVLAVTAAAVAEVRRRGVGHSGGGVDPLLVAAPLLLAVSGGLLLARIEPVVVGWLAALAGRGRGLVGFLGLVRAARDDSGRRRPSALPLLALLIAVTATGFGATVLSAVDQSRSRAARVTVGGDVSVSIPIYASLPEAFTKSAGELPGVRAATGAWIEERATFIGGDRETTDAILVVVDPDAYAEISRTVGVGEYDPAKLTTAPGGKDGAVPALFSRDLAKRLTPGAPQVRTPSGSQMATSVAGVVSATPALPDPGKPFVVVPAGPATEHLPELKRATKVNKWFAVGDVDPDRVRALLMERGLGGGAQLGRVGKLIEDEAKAAGKTSGGLPPGYAVHSSREKLTELAADPVQHAAGRLFWYAGFAAAGFALLAVLLTLLRAAPDRTAVLARLRTMGLRPRQGLALIVAEALPQTLAAAVGGGLVALAAVALLGGAFDLSALVGATVAETLSPAVMPVLLPTVGLTLVVGLGVVVETLIAGRRQIATELRAGERQ
ncbi:FtsX-like permease family protein [Kitasatospora sp. NPDC005856]|uniref:FtsX-like permease family protein n=1 Tax=Kitasatospora sp. NPDC005856 TaxID=3154566 RepID=UPI0033E44B38